MEHLDQRKHGAEIKLYNALKSLSDDYVVFHTVTWENIGDEGETDFIIFNRAIELALKASPAAVIKKPGLAADIGLDRPLRDMRDQYGYTMPALKEKIKE